MRNFLRVLCLIALPLLLWFTCDLSTFGRICGLCFYCSSTVTIVCICIQLNGRANLETCNSSSCMVEIVNAANCWSESLLPCIG